MNYNTQNINTLDIKKYDRIFAFGCSFTNYYWPTWADIIAHENPQADYINRAMPGAGNTYIVAHISQAIRYFNIGPNDLVTTMWSTFYRQDRYKIDDYLDQKRWRLPGNIYTQDDIPHDILLKYFNDTRGYAIRDFALIDTTQRMLQGADFDSVSMWGVSPKLQNYYGLSQHPECEVQWKDVELLYKDLDSHILPDLLGTGCGGHWEETFTFKNEDNSDFPDYHPKTSKYAEYLDKIGIVLTEDTKQWAQQCDEYTASIMYRDDLDYLHKWYETL
jgi:hypothetical protein